MGKYFSLVDGEVHDWEYKKHPQGPGWYIFQIGDRKLGYVVKEAGTGSKWCAIIIYGRLSLDGPVNGFASRCDACLFLLQVMRAHDKRKEVVDGQD